MSEEKTKQNYVNNKELLAEIVRWKNECREAGHIVKQSDMIGESIRLISEGLSKRFNFSNYTPAWKEEMISDGIEVAIKYLFNFDETKYNNPHAYISQACFNAFVARIKLEKEELATKYKYFVSEVYNSCDADMVEVADESFIQDIYDKLNKYEESIKSKPKPKPKISEGKTVEFLYGD